MNRFFFFSGAGRSLFLAALLLGASGLARAQSFGLVTPYSLGAGNLPMGVALGDINNDSHPDLVAAVGSSTLNPRPGMVGVWLGAGDGTFGGAALYPTGVAGLPQALKLSDLNHDGKLDLVLATGSLVAVLPGSGTGTFGPATAYAALMSGNLHSLALGDVNADGWVDVVTVCNAPATASVLLGQPGGTLAPAAVYSVGGGIGAQPQAVALGDFDGDGALDIAATNTGLNSVGCLLGTGSGTFGPVVTYSTSASVSAFSIGLAVGDVNQDGRLDVLGSNYAGTVDVLLGLGNGKFTLGGTYAVGVAPLDLALGDVNGDGTLDVVSADFGSGALTVAPGTGTGSFGAAVSYPVGTSSSNTLGVLLGDLNGDGAPDLVAANYGDGTIGVLLNLAPYFTLTGPASGGAGAGIVLAGSRLAGASKVTFSSSSQGATVVPAGSFTSTNYTATPNTIGLQVPASLAAGTYALTITTSAGTSAPRPFAVTAALAAGSGLASESISVFPSPAHASATVLVPALAGVAEVRLHLYDALGRPVLTQLAALPATGLRQALDLRGLAPGVYWLRVQAGASCAIRRLLVE